MSYLDFARRIQATRVLTDPWIDGAPRFREAPLVLARRDLDALYRAAEETAVLYNEVCRLCAAEPALVDEVFGLTPFQKLMWLASAPAWHGVARADVFRTARGLAVCELNCDTPSGEAEAILLNELARAARPDLDDPNAALLSRVARMIDALSPAPCASVGVVYPTEITEDLSMIALYRRAFERAGWRVTLGSPYNLDVDARGRATLMGEPCDVLVRHYKTDWWSEREPVWLDEEPVPDAAPLDAPLARVLACALAGKVAVVNPFGAVLPQNKRAMALMWERRDLFPPAAQEAIARLVPPTFRLESLDRAALAREPRAWVLKSDYGCEGAEIVDGAACGAGEWRDALERARPGRWIAQRRFDALVETEERESVNYGVYVVAGEACGVLSRVQAGATDRYARTAATLVERGERAS